jgi:hypothetical protein
MSPSAYIIAGPNGAGKTTFAWKFLPNYADCQNFVNADLIAQGISPFSPERAAFRAGRLMLEEIELLAESGADFGFETTLSGRSHLKLIRGLKKRGYGVHFFYFGCQVLISRCRESAKEFRGAVMTYPRRSYGGASSVRLRISWSTFARWQIHGFYLTTRRRHSQSLLPRKKGSFV